jgi:hypothetical protein
MTMSVIVFAVPSSAVPAVAILVDAVMLKSARAALAIGALTTENNPAVNVVAVISAMRCLKDFFIIYAFH